jgi:putative tryptophan/tyrosine transport system substrate-binding protein
MRRRELITLLGGAAAAWPLVARAQQGERARRVAVLLPSRDTDARYQVRVRTLKEGMQQFGWSDGRNVRVDVRWAGDSSERINEIAAELASLAPDVIVCSGSVATAAIKRATASIPVVFGMVNEPVDQGLVVSLARPGGNITGFTNIEFTVIGKMVELLKTMAPALHRIGLMYNSEDYPIFDKYLHELETDRRRPVDVARAAVRQPAEINPVIDSLAAMPGSGLAILPDGGFNNTHRATIRAAVDRHRLPSIAANRQFVLEGALMSYGPDDIDIFRRVADYVSRILKGAKPADLPVQQPVKFELVINSKTAKTLGLDIPPMLLATADEAIE